MHVSGDIPPIKLRRLHPRAIAPNFVHPGDAALSLYSVKEITLPPGGRAGVPIGWAVEFSNHLVARVLGRSGLARDHGVFPIGGVIDANYRGEWQVILLNSGHDPYTIRVGDKIAQVVFHPIVKPAVVEVEELSDTPRGAGGFGSTGR